MRITAAAVHRIAEEEILRKLSNRSTRHSVRRFKGSFGCSPKVAAALWNRLDKKELLPADCLLKHLLWGLLFLKNYNVEDSQAPFLPADEKTYSKWVWIVLDALAELDLVSERHGRRRCKRRREFVRIDAHPC